MMYTAGMSFRRSSERGFARRRGSLRFPAGLAFAVFWSTFVVCASLRAVPPGVNLLNNADFGRRVNGHPVGWILHNQANGGTFSFSPNEKTGVGNTLTVNVHQPSNQPWDVQVRQSINHALEEGDVLKGSFDCTFSKGYWFNCYFQQEGGNWQKYIQLRIDEPAGQWDTHEFTCRIPKDIPKGGSSLTFHLATVEGVVSFRDLSVRLLPQDVDPEAVVEAEALVVGGDAVDREWRKQATERLMRTRRGELTITVTDADGVVAGADVEVQQTGPLLPLGVSVPSEILDPSVRVPTVRSPDVPTAYVDRCRRFVEETGLFKRVFFPNALKWSAWERLDQQALTSLIERLAANDIATHGHALYLPAFRYAPRTSRQMGAAELRPAIGQHIRSQVEALRGRLFHWTVVGYPLTYHEMYDIAGADTIKQAFRTAREVAPNARLYLGEDKALTYAAESRLDEFVAISRWLKLTGAPVDALAVQVAAGRPYLAPKAMEGRLQWLSKAVGLPIVVAGLSVDAPSPDAQERRLRDLVLLFASHPDTEAIYFDELWAPYADRPKSALFGPEFRPRPAADMLSRLFLEEWTTREVAATDATGRVSIEGFTGPYTVSVRHDGRTARRTCRLARQGTSLTIRLGD